MKGCVIPTNARQLTISWISKIALAAEQSLCKQLNKQCVMFCSNAHDFCEHQLKVTRHALIPNSIVLNLRRSRNLTRGWDNSNTFYCEKKQGESISSVTSRDSHSAQVFFSYICTLHTLESKKLPFSLYYDYYKIHLAR